MLKHISVRTFIIVFLLLTFCLINTVQIMYSVALPVFIAMNIIFLLALLSLWCYMTIYLVTPINTVK
ncbi:chemoreceptor protein, partial [Salmonella enterica subsp. enterica serovar Reading]|nr:chemoreceptor protein [Salmonella enterica subsp. enterica serovar Reading]